MKQNGNGFTIAEVLITLVIIGIIGALTVPSLIQRTQKQEYVSALKKAYSTLSNATQQIIAEEGSPKSSCETCEDGWAHSIDNVYNLYKTKLNIAKDCGSGTGCFPQHAAHGYNFLNSGYDGNWNNSGDSRKVVLSDGMQLLFGSSGFSSTCSGYLHEDYGEQRCMDLAVDINGYKKPNVWGRDVIMFELKENGLYPAGCDINYCTGEGSKGRGYGCACKVLREGAMNY